MSIPTPDQRISECGKAFAVAALPAYTNAGAVHPPTLVAACARMAGFYLLRSVGAVSGAMPSGAAILSPQVAARSPVLARTCAAVLASLGHVLPPEPPQPLVAPEAKPREDVLQAQARLLPVFAPIQARFALDDDQAARAAAVAAALVAHTVRKHLDAGRSFGLAVFGFAEGSQTVPGP